jgi:tetratricopeptide (TPR) repeat protein
MKNRHMQLRTTVLPIAALLLALTIVPAQALAQSDQDALFAQGVDAYNKNQFLQALEKFQQISGPHTQEAQQYTGKMKSYQEAMQLAKGIMDRSPDERDATSLEYAIQQFQRAIQIKPDGPWQPADQLAKARDLKAQVEKAHAAVSKTMDADFCAKALAAAAERHYKEAAQFSCPLANDNPGYSCGADEAVHLCQLNTDLAKLEKTTPERSTPSVEPATHSAAIDNARAAYDRNDLERARTLFQRVDADSKPTADDFLDKISRYTDAMTHGEKLSRDGQYDQARAAFLAAAAIKPDGPGDPQNRASATELFLGLDQFYSGDYASAIQHLQDCARTGTQKQPLVRFYLGASELAKFFVTGSEDSSLHQEALNDLKQAKQAGFKTTGQDVSPKILRVYKDLSF